LIEVKNMALALVNSFAPPVRFDHDAHTESPVIDARNIGVNFKVEHGTVEAVKDISFQLYRGETIAIVGESGSGKSVTARTVMGLLSKRAVDAPKTTVD
jgi:peptide/nickel transport system ATP-binding protein